MTTDDSTVELGWEQGVSDEWHPRPTNGRSWVEFRIVIPVVVDSSPIRYPKEFKQLSQIFAVVLLSVARCTFVYSVCTPIFIDMSA